MFDHRLYNQLFLTKPGNDAAQWYEVRINPAQAQQGEIYYKCIGVHHLLPEENTGKHSVFLEVLDEAGQRVNGALIGWDWEGRRPTEQAPPVRLDKPPREPGADIAMHGGQKVSVWVTGARSDRVENLHTYHPDQGSGNTIGHHSFYVVFQRTRAGATVPPPPVIPPPPVEPETPPPPADDFSRTVKIFEDDHTRIYLIIETF
jgi:hypothetical protein